MSVNDAAASTVSVTGADVSGPDAAGAAACFELLAQPASASEAAMATTATVRVFHIGHSNG